MTYIMSSRKMQSLGERQMPNKKYHQGVKHSEALYFLMDVDVRVGDLPRIKDEYLRDKDIIQFAIFAKDKQEELVCPETLDAELLPPAERPSVQELVAAGRRPPRFRKIWEDRTGLGYYPFHR